MTPSIDTMPADVLRDAQGKLEYLALVITGREPGEARELTAAEAAWFAFDTYQTRLRMGVVGPDWRDVLIDSTDKQVCEDWIQTVNEYCRDRGYF